MINKCLNNADSFHDELSEIFYFNTVPKVIIKTKDAIFICFKCLGNCELECSCLLNNVWHIIQLI